MSTPTNLRESRLRSVLKAITYRITGHSRRDACNYQPKDERRQAKKDEPIRRFEAFAEKTGLATEAELDQIREEIDAEIEAAVVSAQAAPDPKPEDALEDLWV